MPPRPEGTSTARAIRSLSWLALAGLPVTRYPTQWSSSSSLGAVYRELFVDFFTKPAALWGIALALVSHLAEVQLDGVERPWRLTSPGHASQMHALVLLGSALAGTAGLAIAGATTAILRLQRTLRPLSYAALASASCVIALVTFHPKSALVMGGLVAMHDFFAGLVGAGVLIYLMQQAAPGRFVMSHFGIAMGAYGIASAVGKPLGTAIGAALGPIPAVLVAVACAAAVPLLARVAPVHDPRIL